MKNNSIKILFSLFFAIAIGVHVNYTIEGDKHPFWWHGIYFITYGVCWAMVFSKNKYRALIFSLAAIFPFLTHVYYAYRRLPSFDFIFWVCAVVCLILALGVFWMVKTPDPLPATQK